MSYESRDEQDQRDEEYQKLKVHKTRLETQVANWIDKGTSLYADSPLQTDKDDLATLRDSFIAALSLSIGV